MKERKFAYAKGSGPSGQCDMCGSTNIQSSRNMTTAGVIVLLFGIVLSPVLIGIVLIFCALSMKETVITCSQCGRKL